MQVFTQKTNLKEYLSGKSTGFVPTMGALHRGHISLVERSVQEMPHSVVSIFVNPTQFNNPDDLKRYPRSLREDLAMLESAGCDAVYIPDVKDVYGEHPEEEHYDFGGLDRVMEGAHRPGHFDGVWSVVRRLFEIVEPERAYFGEKDFQQLQIIRRMTRLSGMPVEIKGLPIVREPDGLAMSSRNRRLTPEYREAAPFIYRSLKKVKEMFGTKSVPEIYEWVKDEFARQELLEPEYFIIAEEESLLPVQQVEKGKKYRAFTAVYAGEIRLIDNISLI